MSQAGFGTVLANSKTAIVSFDAELARVAGALCATIKHLGLAPGDRACFALAQKPDVTALTADRARSRLDLEFMPSACVGGRFRGTAFDSEPAPSEIG